MPGCRISFIFYAISMKYITHSKLSSIFLLSNLLEHCSVISSQRICLKLDWSLEINVKMFSIFSSCLYGLMGNTYCCCCLVAKSCPILLRPHRLAHQGPLSMGFPRQEYWKGLPFLSPWDISNQEILPMSPTLAGEFFPTESLGKPNTYCYQ